MHQEENTDDWMIHLSLFLLLTYSKTMHNEWWHERKLNNFIETVALESVLRSTGTFSNYYADSKSVYNEGVCTCRRANTKTSKMCSVLCTIIMMLFYTSRTMLHIGYTYWHSSPIVLALFVASYSKVINKLLIKKPFCAFTCTYLCEEIGVHTEFFCAHHIQRLSFVLCFICTHVCW